jgi:transcription antitermination factor NusG
MPAYTKPRCEKVVTEYCSRHGIPCYLPLLRKAKRYQRRTVESLLPMVRSYVFVQLSAMSKPLLLQSHKIIQLYPVDRLQEEQLVLELCGIRQMEAMQAEADLIVLPELSPGQPVKVNSGPLAGLTGIVERRRNRTRVTINVELLGQAVAAEVDVGEIEPDDD